MEPIRGFHCVGEANYGDESMLDSAPEWLPMENSTNQSVFIGKHHSDVMLNANYAAMLICHSAPGWLRVDVQPIRGLTAGFVENSVAEWRSTPLMGQPSNAGQSGRNRSKLCESTSTLDWLYETVNQSEAVHLGPGVQGNTRGSRPTATNAVSKRGLIMRNDLDS